MNIHELSKMKLIKGDLILRAHGSDNTLQGIFDSYNQETGVFTFTPAGAKRSKSEYLRDIDAIIRLEGVD